MKKKILKFFMLIMVNLLFAAPSVLYNKNVKNAKNFDIDIMDVVFKPVKDNYENFLGLGIVGVGYNYYTEISFDEGTLLILRKYQREYVNGNFFNSLKKLDFISKNKPGFTVYFKNKDEKKYSKAIDGCYFRVGDKTEKVEFFYLKAEKRTIADDDVFKECVDLYIMVTFLGKTICIINPCYLLPFKTAKDDYDKAATTDDIIKLFGLPDLVDSYYFKWPDEKTKNGIYYSPDIDRSAMGEHWFFKKYPDLVLDISGKKVKNFTTFVNDYFSETNRRRN